MVVVTISNQHINSDNIEWNMIYIGEASKQSGATVKAIRLYEQLGLLSNITRVNSYRIFHENDILIIKYIKIAQKVGFKLSEIKEILFPKDEAISWDKIRQEIEIKETNIANDILSLQNNIKQLGIYRKEISDCIKIQEKCLFPQTNNKS